MSNVSNISKVFNIFNLPSNIINKIMEYDPTYHEQYKKVLNEIKMFPVWNAKHITDTDESVNYYFHYTIATDIINYWNKTYTTYIKNLLNNSSASNSNSNNSSNNSSNTREINETRELINFLDNNNISTEIIGRKQTLFQWIRYYRKIC